MTVQAPRIILASVVGPSAVALYSVTTMLMRMVRIPIDIPAHAATVELSMAVGKGDFEGARNLLQGTTRFSMWLALAAIPVVLVVGPTVTTLWTAGRITPSYDLLLICCASTALFSLALPSQEALMSVNKLDRATFWIVAMAAPYLGLSWLLAKSIGLDGVAIAVLIMDAAYAGISLFWVTRFFDIPASALGKALAKPPFDLVRSEANLVITKLRKFAAR
jgi:O-antigen/teichoic acid export membrane protein